MGWDEVCTRAGQEVGKRLDLIAYRAGRNFRPGKLSLREKLGERFFFENNDLPGRIGLLKQFLPAEAAVIIDEADSVCRHRFSLLGYPCLDYGPEIDWHLDAVHGKRAPLKPWYRIDYLDFQEVGDHKDIWELNRHQHLVTRAKAWRVSGEARYLAELVHGWSS